MILFIFLCIYENIVLHFVCFAKIQQMCLLSYWVNLVTHQSLYIFSTYYFPWTFFILTADIIGHLCTILYYLHAVTWFNYLMSLPKWIILPFRGLKTYMWVFHSPYWLATYFIFFYFPPLSYKSCRGFR